MARPRTFVSMTETDEYEGHPWRGSHPGWGVGGPAIGLLWFAFPIATLVASRPNAAHIALATVGVLVFATIWVGRGLRPEWAVSTREELAYVAALAAIAIVLTLAERPEWAMLFAFTGVPVGLRLPPALGFWGVFALAALAGGCSLLAGADDTAATWAATTIGTGLLFVALGRVLNANAQLRRARAELATRAVAEERLRFGRDLHDLLGHSLSVIAIKAELARRLLPDRAEQAGTHVHEIETVAREALAGGYGLAGLRERAERVGGRLEAGPRPGGGFGLRVTVPATP
jgi:two-component system sensor histidine kinase DesK